MAGRSIAICIAFRTLISLKGATSFLGSRYYSLVEFLSALFPGLFSASVEPAHETFVQTPILPARIAAKQ